MTTTQEVLEAARDALLHMCLNTTAKDGYRGELVDAALARINAARAEPKQTTRTPVQLDFFDV